MPELIIIAGPNGAGKTTFATEYFRDARRFAFINADEIASELPRQGAPAAQRDIRAGRRMLERIEELVNVGADFMFESTLATLVYAQKIPMWQRQGYAVVLIYLRLASDEQSIARVRRRVAAGGHDIPEPVIRRRFGKSLAYFETVYRPIVDEWYIYESVEGDFVKSESWLAP